jgi:cell wall-associated NlpC family hydrolase
MEGVPATLDPRLHAFREDLADRRLAGRVAAGRFVAGEPARVVRGWAALVRRPGDGAPLETELLFGEPVLCFERSDGWAWVQSGWDGYVGYVEAGALGPPAAREPDRQVAALRTFLHAAPDLKAPVLDCLSMASRVATVPAEKGFVAVDGGGFVFAAHLAPLRGDERRPLEVASAFLGTPYRWGGRTSVGLDCSALVQVSLALGGAWVPRDADLQAAALGAPVPFAPEDPRPEPGDVLCFPRHVAFAWDAETVLHATAHSMRVCLEPLADVVARSVRETGRGVVAIRRPPGPLPS